MTAIEIIVGLITGLLCGVLQTILMQKLIEHKGFRWLIFIGKLFVYVAAFVGMILYSTAALLSCAGASLLALWVTSIARYRKNNGKFDGESKIKEE